MLSGSCVILSPHNVTLFHIHGVNRADEKRREKEDVRERHCSGQWLLSDFLQWPPLCGFLNFVLGFAHSKHPCITDGEPRHYAIFNKIH